MIFINIDLVKLIYTSGVRPIEKLFLQRKNIFMQSSNTNKHIISKPQTSEVKNSISKVTLTS